MDISFFATGLLIGFSIAAPVGPIGVLCLRRTLAEGRLYGFVTGLGAATADATYGAVAAMGLTAISGLLVSQQLWLKLVGGTFLCYLGVRTFLSRPTERAAGEVRSDLAGAYASTLFLTLTNPLTILSFAAVFGGLGLGVTGGGELGAVLVVAGVFSGSALWWLLLSSAASALRSRLRPEGLTWVNRLSGVIILAFGIAALVGVWL